jgi:hypothetical protein
MRRRLPIVLLAALCVTFAGQALAPGASKPTVRLPSAAGCLKHTAVRLVFSPPADEAIASLSVRVGASEVLQLANLTGAGSLVVRVPRPGTRLSVTGSTTSGRFFTVRRNYDRWARKAPSAPAAPAPTPVGGGGGAG